MSDHERTDAIDAQLLRLVEGGPKPYLALIRTFDDLADRRLAMQRLHALDRAGRMRAELRPRADKPALWFGPATTEVARADV